MKTPISRNYELLFRYFCKHGDLEQAMNLHYLVDHKCIKVSFNYFDRSFQQACINNHLDVAQWLLNTNPNINVYIKIPLLVRHTVLYEYLTMFQWLLDIAPKYTNHPVAFRELFIFACEEGQLPFVQHMVKIKEDQPAINQSLVFRDGFYHACYRGHNSVVRYLADKVNIHSEVFEEVKNKISSLCMTLCSEGYLEVMKFIVESLIGVNEIPMYFKYKQSLFECVCTRGYLDFAQQLFSWFPNMNIEWNDHIAFRSACKNNNRDIALWLVSLFPEKYSIQAPQNESTSISIPYEIKYVIKKCKTITYVEHPLDNCSICIQENKQIVNSVCNHSFCEPCISKWLSINHKKECPCCRQSLENTSFIVIQNKLIK